MTDEDVAEDDASVLVSTRQTVMGLRLKTLSSMWFDDEERCNAGISPHINSWYAS